MKMDLSIYYEELKSSYNSANVVLCIALSVILFLFICRIFDKSVSLTKNIIACLLLIMLLGFFIVQYFNGAYLAKKDIEQQTIHYYEGDFEIIEITNSWINDKVLLSICGKEILLDYFEGERYEFDKIKLGEYKGKIVYAQHLAEIYYIELYPRIE